MMMMRKWGNSGFQPHIRLSCSNKQTRVRPHTSSTYISLHRWLLISPQSMSSICGNQTVCGCSLLDPPTHICALLSSSRYTQILMKMTSGQKKRAGRVRKYMEHSTLLYSNTCLHKKKNLNQNKRKFQSM